MWRNHLHLGLHQIVPIVNLFRIAFPHEEQDRRGVRATVVGQPPLPIRGYQVGLGGQASTSYAKANVTTEASSPSITDRACFPDPPCDVWSVTVCPVSWRQCLGMPGQIRCRARGSDRKKRSSNSDPGPPEGPQPASESRPAAQSATEGWLDESRLSLSYL